MLPGSAAGHLAHVIHSWGQKNLPIRHRLLPPLVGTHGVCVGQAGGGVCVVHCAAHHNGAGESVVVVPW